MSRLFGNHGVKNVDGGTGKEDAVRMKDPGAKEAVLEIIPAHLSKDFYGSWQLGFPRNGAHCEGKHVHVGQPRVGAFQRRPRELVDGLYEFLASPEITQNLVDAPNGSGGGEHLDEEKVMVMLQQLLRVESFEHGALDPNRIWRRMLPPVCCSFVDEILC